MSSTGLSQKLAKFKQNFSQILGPKRQGYNEVGLEQPLVSSHAQSDDQYFQKHGVSRPGSQQASGYGQYQDTQGAGAYAGAGDSGITYTSGSAATIPDEGDELRGLAGLARDAAEILFEMAALRDESDAAQDMLEKSQQLEAQLRGMIGDARGSDETALAQALEAFDVLSNSKDEYLAVIKRQAPSAAAAAAAPASQAPVLQPPSSSNPFQANPFGASSAAPIVTAPGHKPAGEEPPLISFD